MTPRQLLRRRIRPHEHLCDLCLVVPVAANACCLACGRLSPLAYLWRLYWQHLHLWWLSALWRWRYGRNSEAEE